MKTSDFYYDLPEELIAQDPLKDRSSSRLLVLRKDTGETEHRIFSDIIEYLDPGDCLVINDTKVIPARLHGIKEGTGAHIEVLLLKNTGNYYSNAYILMRKIVLINMRILKHTLSTILLEPISFSQMVLHNIISFSNNPCRATSHNRKGRHIFRNHAARRNYGAISNFNPR